MRQPDYERGGVRLYCGDCLDILPTLEPGSIDAVVADPPYGMGLNTDSRRFSGGTSPHINRPRGVGRDDWGDIVGDDTPFDPTHWLQFDRVILWGCNHYAQRLPVGTTLVWIKRADHLFGTFLSDCELAWMKGGHGVYAYRQQFAPPSRIVEGNGSTAHPCQKPIGLMAWCIEKLKVPVGGIALDPFMGSGTTGVACVRLGRKFVGIEIERRWFDVAVRRIDAAFDETALLDGKWREEQLALPGVEVAS